MSSRSFEKPIRIPGKQIAITKKMIEDSQAVTKSNSAAARWLGVHYLTYRKYAKIYGLWERHLNPLAMRAYDEYFKLAKDNNLTMVQLAQSFVNSRPFVTSNIIGATTMGQLRENIDSIDIELTLSLIHI